MEESRLERRWQFCARCGQLMFEYFRSSDGHFGVVDEVGQGKSTRKSEIRCPTCGAHYRLLDRLSPFGQPIVRT